MSKLAEMETLRDNIAILEARLLQLRIFASEYEVISEEVARLKDKLATMHIERSD